MADQPVSGSPFGSVIQGGGEEVLADTSRPHLSHWQGALRDELSLIRNRIILGRNHQAALRAEQDTDYRFYDLKYTFSMPEDAEKIPYPGPRSDVDTIVDHLIPDLILTSVKPRTESAANRDLANRHEHIYNGLWYNADLQAQEYDAPSPARAATKDGVISGEFCFEVLDQRHLWGREPDQGTPQHYLWELQKARTAPVYIGVVDPRQVYLDPSRPYQWAVKEYNRQVVDIVAQLEGWEGQGVTIHWERVPGLRDLKMWSDHTTRRWQEYWGKDADGKAIKCFLVDEVAMVGPVANPLGFIPFVKRSSGGGRGGPNTPPEDRVWGVIRTVRPFYEAISRRLTQVDSLVQSFAWGTWIAKGDTQQMQINLGPNKVSTVPLGDGNSLTPYYPPPLVLQPILEELRELMSMAQWTVSPQVLRGQKQPGQQAAYQYVLQLQEARLRIVSLKRALELAMVEVCHKAALILKLADEPIDVMTVTVKGEKRTEAISSEDIDPSLQITLELQQETPEENDRRVAIGERLYQNKEIDWWTFQEKYLKNEDPERTFKRIIAWEFINAPEVKAAFNEDVAREYDAALYERLVQAREKLRQQVGQPPTVAAPPSPEQAAGIGPAGAMPGSADALLAEQQLLAQPGGQVL